MNEQNLKDNLKQVFIQRLKKDFEQYDTYLFNSQKVDNMIYDGYEELLVDIIEFMDEIKKEMKIAIKEKVLNELSVTEILKKIEDYRNCSDIK